MQTSRDDFIIAIRSAFLKKETQQTFSLLGLISFSLILLILGSFNFKIINYIKIIVKEGVYKSSLIVSVPEKLIKNTYFVSKEYFGFYDEYKKEKLELKVLRSKDLLNEFIIIENNRLKNIIDDYLVETDEIIAKILIDKQSPFSRSVIANKGSKNNIKKGMVVLDGEYLVGKVIEVNYMTSRILLLSDFNSKIPVSIEPAGVQSILSGSGKDDAIIQYLKEDYTIEDNAVVYTSGSGGLFKAGIPIGKIKNLDLDLDKERSVKFFSDFSQLRFVKILSYEEAKTKAKEKIKLEAQKELKIKTKKEVELRAQKIKKLEVEYEIKLKAEEVSRLKAEEVSRLKTEENLALNIEEQNSFKDLELKYSSKCKKTFFNKLYRVGTSEYKNCILNKGIKIIR
jgi:rod shape-determining protein MreC